MDLSVASQQAFAVLRLEYCRARVVHKSQNDLSNVKGLPDIRVY
jgi:hypothetical protein